MNGTQRKKYAFPAQIDDDPARRRALQRVEGAALMESVLSSPHSIIVRRSGTASWLGVRTPDMIMPAAKFKCGTRRKNAAAVAEARFTRVVRNSAATRRVQK